MLNAIVLFSALRVVEAIERAYQVARDTADALETDIVVFGAAALRAAIADDAVVAADRIAVDRVSA